MFGGLFKSVAGLVVDVVEVVATPVEMVVDLASAAIQPVVEVCKDLKDDVKSINN